MAKSSTSSGKGARLITKKVRSRVVNAMKKVRYVPQ
jgi:hypothetical protein